MNHKIVLITGASSGIGYETARRLVLQGHKVYGAARRPELIEPLCQYGVVPMAMDVTVSDSMDAAVRRIIEEEGRIDVLVNNAGYGYLGPVETVPLEEARRQLEVNLFGMAYLTQLVLPYMRERHSGHIINISSIAGRAVILFGGWYNVSKFAVEAFSDALRMEVKPFGIRVSIIEPSGIKTPWGIIAAENLETSVQGSAYEKQGLRMAGTFRWAYGSDLMSKPASVTRSIVSAVNARHPSTRYHPGLGAHTIIFLHSILPTRLWDSFARLIGR